MANPYRPPQTTTNAHGYKQFPAERDLTVTDDKLVYAAKMSSCLTGEEKTFHFVLSTDRYKGNRIPPRGFRITAAPSRIVQPRWHGADAPG